MTNLHRAWLFWAVLTATASVPLRATNLFSNPGFETGSFAGWTLTPAGTGSDFSVTCAHSNTGNCSAEFGAAGPGEDAISQTLTTVASQPYLLTFFLETTGSTRDFQVFWDGSQILDVTGAGSDTWVPYSFVESASSTSTVVSFQGLNTLSFDYLDDVSAVAAPEPASAALTSLGVLALMVSLKLKTRATR